MTLFFLLKTAILCGFCGIISKVRNGVISMPKISTDFIRLEQFLKLCDITSTGGQAKQLIREGKVLVNGETELRRGRKLYPGDTVTAEGKTLTVE